MIVLGANLAQNPRKRMIRRKPASNVSGGGCRAETNMPSLLRFLAVIGVIAGIGFGVIYALAFLADPKPRDISITIPPDRFYKQR
jgi:hypothetical protein